MKSLKRFFCVFLLFFLILAQIFPNLTLNELLNARDTLFRLGKIVERKSLRTRDILSRSIKEGIRFAAKSGEGGVLFLAVAEPEDANIKNQAVSLRYDERKSDGSRLQITIGGKTITAQNLYDWMLLPLACYADSEYINGVTLLDDPRDEDERDRVEFDKELIKSGDLKEKGKSVYWAAYHPALVNTLVGFNAFLVDAMLFDCGKFYNCITDLEHLEGYNDYEANPTYKRILSIVGSDHVMHVDEAFELLGLMGVPIYSTYIYAEPDEGVFFRIEKDNIVFTGTPFYHFLYKYTSQSVRNAEIIVEEAEAINQYFDAYPELINGINPTVYDTAKKTAQWTAFFRYLKKNHEKAWGAFMAQIKPKTMNPDYNRVAGEANNETYKQYRYAIDPKYSCQTPRKLDFISFYGKEIEARCKDFMEKRQANRRLLSISGTDLTMASWRPSWFNKNLRISASDHTRKVQGREFQK